ncbi:hypothetical protein NM688_g6921 [Phlebia brevispora]|uniref:Uncharacterized protein n=1 Tax=Phlebia brevispora TaxID=194682 RepID=A0ACC1SBE9_9APHY|nr:hypothetical protein NM688_g6921 [Phlebia brevispora]
MSDAFLISCTITEAPTPPTPPSPIPYQLVPKELLTVMGALLDDPNYSDVEFVLPRRHGGARGKNNKPRVIYANKKLLTRVDYFDTMFQSGFAECASYATNPGDRSMSDSDSTMAPPGSDLVTTSADDDVETVSGVDSIPLPKFEDSDDEDDYFDFDTSEADCEEEADDTMLSVPSIAVRPVENDSGNANANESQQSGESAAQEFLENLMDLEIEEDESNSRNVQRKLSHPSSPRSETMLAKPEEQAEPEQTLPVKPTQDVEKPIPGPTKVRVVIKDAAYATYRAVLYYIYTDTITFAPLASSFPSYTMSTSTSSINTGSAQGSKSFSLIGEPSTRREWLRAWEARHPDKPRPSSAKAVYRLADKLDLQDLKERAFQHIIKSLTVENVAYETFSHFSAAFDDVRKVEINYFLEHWAEIRDSPMMRNVWQQIRMGRHPGFEEVWPLIATNLEYKSKDTPVATQTQ